MKKLIVHFFVSIIALGHVFTTCLLAQSQPQTVTPKLDTAGSETDVLLPGVKLFLNRDYTAKEVPDALHGCKFIRANLERSRVVCREAGAVWVLTQLPERGGDSLGKTLEARGFKRVEGLAFELFRANLVTAFQKQVAKDEVLEIGKWGVVVLPEKKASASVTKPAAPPAPGVVTSEFIFESAPFPSCHASTIVETKAGLVAAWFGGTKEGHPDVGIWLARQVNGQWTPPVEVANGAETETPRVNTLNPVLFQVPDGPLLLFYKTGKWWAYTKTSTDGGGTWSKPQRMANGFFGPVKNKPVKLSDGSIFSPSSSEFPGDGWRVHFERSTDGGKTWQFIGPINDGKEIAAIQPSILFHPGGKLQALGRTQQGKIFETWSADNGATWSVMKLTDLPNPNSGTDAVTLRDGRQLLVYNHTEKGRSPLNVAMSADGRHWQAAAVLEDEPKKEFSYPAVIQTGDGLVHITYTWKRERIKHVVLDPAKLKLTPLAAGP